MNSAVDHLRERTLSRQTIFEGGIITLHHDKVELPSGRTGSREVVEHPGSIGVVALDDRGQAVLVRQWRHPMGRDTWEVCAGTLHRGEDPLECAKRELAEETGYTASSWTALGAYSLVPGYSTEVMSLFLATGLAAGDPNPDEDEILDVEAFDSPALLALIEAGSVDMKTIGALALAGIPVRG